MLPYNDGPIQLQRECLKLYESNSVCFQLRFYIMLNPLFLLLHVFDNLALHYIVVFTILHIFKLNFLKILFCMLFLRNKKYSFQFLQVYAKRVWYETNPVISNLYSITSLNSLNMIGLVLIKIKQFTSKQTSNILLFFIHFYAESMFIKVSNKIIIVKILVNSIISCS